MSHCTLSYLIYIYIYSCNSDNYLQQLKLLFVLLQLLKATMRKKTEKAEYN